MKLEVGMYVRTEKGIYKINHFINNNYTQKFTYIDNKGVSNILDYEEVIKASHNIIDLIEVGDYVNGDLITSAEDVYTTDNIYIGREVIVKHSYVIIEEDIETIVTREQFSAMEYKID